MKKFLKILAWGFGLVVVLFGLAALYNAKAPLPRYPLNLPEQVTIPYKDSSALRRGQLLVSMTCAVCHQSDEGNLTGGPLGEEDFGEIYVANITNHPTLGTGKYTDRELLHLLRTGIRPDGSQLVPVMPRFHQMSDDDLGAIIAYLRSDDAPVKAADQSWPENRPSFLAKALTRMVFRPAPMPEGEVTAPPITDLPAHGEYLANAVFNCFQCHSASFSSNNDMEPALSAGYYAGGNPIVDSEGVLFRSANLTPHPDYGLGGWSLADFTRAVRSRQRPDGRVLSEAMPLFAGLSDEEVAAIWAFLNTLPANANNPNE